MKVKDMDADTVVGSPAGGTSDADVRVSSVRHPRIRVVA